ncbi:hypothetical protein BURPS668_A0264 [Burkholderia pseudomallei 668]|nr:hypothetical protein BURPS668_A0264 [Burkholderia pseudomallei 668]
MGPRGGHAPLRKRGVRRVRRVRLAASGSCCQASARRALVAETGVAV